MLFEARRLKAVDYSVISQKRNLSELIAHINNSPFNQKGDVIEIHNITLSKYLFWGAIHDTTNKFEKFEGY